VPAAIGDEKMNDETKLTIGAIFNLETVMTIHPTASSLTTHTALTTAGSLSGIFHRWTPVVMWMCIAWLTSPALSHDQIPGAPQTRPIMISGAMIHVVDGPVIEQGSILFDHGKITAVGQQLALPRGAEQIDATGKHVYPGLIESMTDLGLREIAAVSETADHSERGSLNPNVQSWVAINPDSELIPVARAGGVLLALVCPRGDWLRGRSAVVQLDGWTPAEMTLLPTAGLCVNWNAMHPRESDAKKRAGKQAEKFKELDDLIEAARRYGKARAARPEQTATNLRLESLLSVVEGTLPLIAEANRQEVIESAVTYAQSNGLRLVIYGGYDAADCAELLKRYDIPVIIGSVYRLPLRRHDPYDAPFTLAQRLQAAGIRYCIGGEGDGSPGGAANTRNLPYHAACAVAFGLTREQAIRSITLSAAEILGVDDRVGSLTVGKDATLIVCDGDLLETKSNVTTAFIQGRRVDLRSRHTMLHEKYQTKYER